MSEASNPAFLSLLGRKGVGKSSVGQHLRVNTSDFAVRGQFSQGVDDVGKGWAFLEAKRPTTNHELVDFAGASVWNRQLQLPRLQPCRTEDYFTRSET